MESLLTTAQRLLTIQSTADRPATLHEALAVIADRLSAHSNISIERFESNGKPSLLVYKGKQRPRTFRVLLNGHLDVVPAQKEQFLPIIKNECLYGRGALDMKVAALAMTDMFANMVENVPYALGLQIVTDEEVGGEDGTAFQLSRGVDTQFAIAGEATPLGAICNESRGFCWAEVEFAGIAAHGAYPWNGTNAILLAQEFTQKLLTAIPTPQQDEWCTTVNIATISTSNTTFNRVPDQARIGLDIRFTNSDERFASHQSATDFLQQLAPKNSVVHIQKLEPSHFTDPENSDVKALADVVSKITKQPARLIHKHGSADVRFFSRQGIPSVTLGLQGKNLHGDNEYVEIASIERYVAALTEFLENIKA